MDLVQLRGFLLATQVQSGKYFPDTDRVFKKLTDDVAPKVAADPAYQNAKQNTPQTARLEHDRALARVKLELLKDDTDVYQQFVQDPSFKRFVTDLIFGLTSGAGMGQGNG